MTNDGAKPIVWRLFLLGFLIAFALVAVGGIWFFYLKSPLSLNQLNRTTVSHSLVVEQVEKVAKLVSSEITLRDVVIYENTWYGSTKRSLVVVTGKVLAGINLAVGSEVMIDEPTRRITITLPQASVLGIDITEIKTYDEQRGWWNPFTPADRDAIFQLAREQLGQTSGELKIATTAQESATELLQNMFSTDGYTVTVVYR